jgi:hypothetical protein
MQRNSTVLICIQYFIFYGRNDNIGTSDFDETFFRYAVSSGDASLKCWTVVGSQPVKESALRPPRKAARAGLKDEESSYTFSAEGW